MSSFVPGKSRANFYFVPFVSCQVPGINYYIQSLDIRRSKYVYAERLSTLELIADARTSFFCLGCPTAIMFFAPRHRTVLCVVRSRLCGVDINRAGLWFVSTAERGLWLFFFLGGPNGSHRGTTHRRAAKLHQLTSVSFKQYERSCYSNISYITPPLGKLRSHRIG